MVISSYQQLSLFNGFYDSNCYLPLVEFLTFDQEPDQYLFSYLLRPGNVDAKEGCFGLLKRVLPKLRQAFPGAVIRLRLDSGFSGPDILVGRIFMSSWRPRDVSTLWGWRRTRCLRHWLSLPWQWFAKTLIKILKPSVMTTISMRRARGRISVSVQTTTSFPCGSIGY